MTEPTTQEAAAADVETYRILLIEDDPGDALLVEELLTDTGLAHDLRWKQTLADALADLAEDTPDCVLLDLNLPDASGIPAVGAVQKACPNAAVIVLTGLAEPHAGIRAVASGAQDYLVKGQVQAELLNRVVRYAVHRKQAERAGAELRENLIQARENARLERGLLPTPLLRTPEVGVASRYLPGRERALLGGDFLDVVQTPDGLVHAVIGDVSGHGPDEAALGVCLRITWRALVLGGHRDIELLDLLEQVLVAERPRGDMFATCTTLTLDPASGGGSLHLAGHHEPLLVTDGTAREVAAEHGMALGILPGQRAWESSDLLLPPASALLLYTDGLIEGHSGPGSERLGTTGLVELIADAPEPEANRLLDHLVTTAQALNAGRHADDLAILHLTRP
ncbi:PP2C family protein-serine/threonine phosphatase [Streptacidiphilus sp. P02-A3a]|uniref:PP2C family protein-serine/threonine phosphatase n=1 Tax=Streptacidiphilus sp. P02-A3a TaxID=2704468 RepID=UPI0015FD1BD5|nr:SpoIIE family protein phosphatase [Streptacidiphilus sp. P02-A3a]QMU73839.1 fused response regulator/phosphatase [Streptacidiphilus sp. P02-A3a]